MPADLAKVKRNIGRLIEQDAPDEEIAAYLADEGVSESQLRGQPSDPLQEAEAKTYQQRASHPYQPATPPPRFIPRTKEDASAIYTPALEAAGLSLSIPFGGPTPPGLAAGALGFAGGRQVAKGLDWLMGVNQDVRVPPETLPEKLSEAGRDVRTGATYAMGGEAVGALAQAGLNRLAAPIAKRMTPEAKRRVELGQKHGIEQTPAEITQSQNLAKAETGLKWMWGSSGVMHDQSMRELKSLLDARDRLIGSGAPSESVEALGGHIVRRATAELERATGAKRSAIEAIRESVVGRMGSRADLEPLGSASKAAMVGKSEAARKAAAEPFVALKNRVDPATKIETPTVQARAKDFLAQRQGLPEGFQGDAKLITRLRGLAGEESPELVNLKEILSRYSPDTVQGRMAQKNLAKITNETTAKQSWSGLQELRSELKDLVRKEDAATAANLPGLRGQLSKEGGIYGELGKALDEDIANYVNQVGGGLAEEFAAARKGWAEYKQVFTNPVFKAFARSSPEKLQGMLFRPREVTPIRAFRAAVGDEALKPHQARFISDLMGLNSGKEFSAKLLQDNLNRYGPEMLKEAVGAEQYAALKAIARGAKRIEEVPISNPAIKFLARQSPEKVFDSLLSRSATVHTAEKVDAVNYKRLQEIIPLVGEEGKRRIAQKAMERMLTLNKEGFLTPQVMANAESMYGKRTIGILFPPKVVKELEEIAFLAKSMANSQRVAQNASGTAQGIATVGSMTTLMSTLVHAATTGNFAPFAMSTATIGGFNGLARLYLSPLGRKWLTEGLRVPVGSARAMQLGAQLAKLIQDYDEGPAKPSEPPVPVLQAKHPP